MSCICLIPARGGSKGIKCKNIQPLAGKSLIVHTIDHSLKSKLIDETYVTTDDATIKSIADYNGAKVIQRPLSLAEDTTLLEPVIDHALDVLHEKGKEPDIVVMLQCTSPIRRSYDIDNAIRMLISDDYDSVFSVKKNKDLVLRYNSKQKDIIPMNYDYKQRKRRQDMTQEYIETGSIYVFKVDTYKKEGTYICGKKGIYEMPDEYSFEIDEPFDFWLSEKILEEIDWKKLNRGEMESGYQIQK